MNILLAFTATHPDTLAAAPAAAEWVYVGDSDTDYWEALRRFWARGEDLLVLEHDVICRPDVLEGFETCAESWCLHRYSNHDWSDAEAWRNAIGCTRFRRELIAAVPDAVANIEPQHRDWRNVCDGIGSNLRAAGFSHHWHEPPVTHHVMSLSHLASSIGE